MNKKVLGIFAASAAILGSAIIEAPANAQTANLPVEIQVKPAVFLRTYQNLKFVVSTQDLLGGTSVEQTGSYDETTGTITPLPATVPTGTPTDTVTKSVDPLYQVWGGTAGTTVKITPSKNILMSSGGGGLGGSDTVTMSVLEGDGVTATAPAAGTPYQGKAKLQFKFSNTNPSAGTAFTGGQLTISVVSP